MMTLSKTVYDFNLSHLIEGAIAFTAIGLIIAGLISAGMFSAVVFGAVSATIIATIINR
jgi:hypothetical protein